MRKEPREIKGKLLAIIREMAATSWLFVNNSGKDFSRNRKLTFGNMLLLLLGMGGESLRSELLTFTGYSTDTATASAFVQQRAKLLPVALESYNNLAHIERKGWHFLVAPLISLTFTKTDSILFFYFLLYQKDGAPFCLPRPFFPI